MGGDDSQQSDGSPEPSQGRCARQEERRSVKRTPEQALLLSIADGLDDADVVDKPAWVEEQLESYRKHTTGRAVTKGHEKSDTTEAA